MILLLYIIEPGINSIIFKGADQPPINSIAKIVDINIILLYSAKKNIAKIIDEYSVLYPATSSASASVKSKGVRFVSANIDIKKMMAHGNNGIINQIVCICEKTIFIKFKDPVRSMTGKITNPMETS